MRDGRNRSRLIKNLGQSTEIRHEQSRCIKFRCVSYTPYNFACYNFGFRSQRPCVLRRGSATVRLLGMGVQIRSGHGSLSLVCVVRYRYLRRADHWTRGALPSVVCQWDREASIMKRPWPTRRCASRVQKITLVRFCVAKNINNGGILQKKNCPCHELRLRSECVR